VNMSTTNNNESRNSLPSPKRCGHSTHMQTLWNRRYTHVR
jgi:hypothetical protein